MSEETKTAWLIEREDDKNPGCTTGACLGVCKSGKIETQKLELTTPDMALRFCRKQDAENALFVFGLSASYIVTEHQWG